MHFDRSMSKCIYCGLCVRACPTDSLSMSTHFQVDPREQELGRFLFRRNSSQLDQRLDAAEMEQLRKLANLPTDQLGAEDRAWVESHVDPTGPHLIGIYGLGYYSPEEKARVDAEREAKKKAKDAAAAAAKAKAAAAAAAAAQATAPAPAAGQQPANPPAGEAPTGGAAS